VAEISFDPEADERSVEPFLIFTADKCGPGAYNFPLWAVFTSPMYCAGLMLPGMLEGFRFVVIDMEHGAQDRLIELNAPEDHVKLAFLLRDENRFGIWTIHSRAYPLQQVVSVSAHRLHTVAGKYVGKDDPVAIVRTQKMFPAPEEVVSPFMTAHFVAGGARGSHHMPLMPVAINTSLTGPYCLPIVSCVAYSVTGDGMLEVRGVDVFGNRAWDSVRLVAQQKAKEMRAQGPFGSAMVSWTELEYVAYRDVLAELEEQFTVQ
jgi:fructose 1,6-bisphosphate aldolase/phosphatase